MLLWEGLSRTIMKSPPALTSISKGSSLTRPANKLKLAWVGLWAGSFLFANSSPPSSPLTLLPLTLLRGRLSCEEERLEQSYFLVLFLPPSTFVLLPSRSCLEEKLSHEESHLIASNNWGDRGVLIAARMVKETVLRRLEGLAARVVNWLLMECLGSLRGNKSVPSSTDLNNKVTRLTKGPLLSNVRLSCFHYEGKRLA